jgi:hypothetical protein
VTPEVIAAKLTDAAILRNYAEFATLYRPSVATTLVRALDNDHIRRRSIAIEVAALSVASLEDLVFWVNALRRWRPGSEPLFDVLDSVVVRENREHDGSSAAALANLLSWTVADLRRELGLPDDGWLRRLGWSGHQVADHAAGLGELLVILREAVAMRTTDEGVLVTSYNKIKHGALVIAASEGSDIGVSVMLPSRKGPIELASRKHMINTGWIACDDVDVCNLANTVLVANHSIWMLANLVYLYRVDAGWRPPPWPFPEAF